jgi:hypothetical protein
MDISNEDVNRKEDVTSIRAKNEALLTAGMGYGNKKKAHLEAFWSIILPGLLDIGWKTVSCYRCSGELDVTVGFGSLSCLVNATKIAGEGEKEGSMLFVPPKVDIKSGKRNIDYYSRIKDLIARIEERRSTEEAKLADLFREKTRGDQNMELTINPSPRPRRGPGRPPKLSTSLPPRNVRVVDISWKDGGTTYPNRSSRVGEEFQVSSIPPVGQHSSSERTTSEPRYVEHVLFTYTG